MHRSRLFIQCYLFLFILLSSGCEKETERKNIFTKILQKKKDKQLSQKEVKKKVEKFDTYFKNLQSKKAFNGVVLVAKGEQIILEKAYGYEEYKKKKPLSVDAVFQIASVSKQFTAAAILLLKQNGLLSLEDPIQNFIPDFPYKGITIKHLLTHHSGLFNYTYFCDKVWNRNKIIDNQTVIRLINDQKPAPYLPPGRQYDYSNTGYILLAAIVEDVSKLSFEDFMSQHIFQPCKMTNTYVYNHGNPIINPHAVEGYNYGRRKVGKTYLDGVVGDKGVYSTVKDLYRWNRVLFGDSLLKQEVLKEAFEPAFPVKKKKDNYGFGWRIKNYNRDKVVWHSGWWEGYKSIFIRNLKDETVIIVLTNSLSGHLKSAELLDLYYD